MRSGKIVTAGGRCILVLSALFCLCGFAESAGYAPVKGHIMTEWAKNVRPDSVLPEYPRPQMVRAHWLNLNGLWDYAITAKDANLPASFDGKILVPFPAESALSGVGKTVGEKNKLWYGRTFKVPSAWKGKRVLLRFGAADWETTVWVNGKQAGSHKGGFDAFSFDITGALEGSGPQKLTVSVWDPTDQGTQARGKQVANPGGIMYTAVTGIWQTVWLEPVPDAYIDSFKIVPDIDAGQAAIDISLVGGAQGYTIEAQAKDGPVTRSQTKAGIDKQIVLPLKEPKLWSPDSPFLYDLVLTLKDINGKTMDEVKAYFGMRKISLAKDKAGFTRIMLNNKFLFQFGPLDQGWWPDGLYTAPTDEALRYDIELTKKLGFNMARKHVKAESDRWYYWCDKLGLLVWQDMPSGDKFIGPNEPDIQRAADSAAQFKHELQRLVAGHANSPSIIVWVPFNEGWGQFDTAAIADYVKTLDPSRLVNSVSGWADRGVGDMHDIHIYPGPAMPKPEEKRAVVLGEFGGLGLPVPGHTWQEKKNWGYQNFKDIPALTAAYSELIGKLYPMIDQGLSAAVYTQTTDVEIEVNGLATYDRAVVKIDAGQLSRINKGYFQPVIKARNDIFIDSTGVKISNASGSGEMRFTIDGTEPAKSSKLYEAPLTLTDTAVVKARTFWPDGYESGVSQYAVTKVAPREPLGRKDAVPGLRYEYFEDPGKKTSSVNDLKNLTPQAGGIAEEPALYVAKASEYFGLTFDGIIEVPSDGIYTFYTTSDDGSVLFIGDALIVANDYLQGMTERSGQIALKAGLHPIRVEYFQGARGLGLEVRYEGPGIAKQQMPASVLFHSEK
jgi:hypothetical protein